MTNLKTIKQVTAAQREYREAVFAKIKALKAEIATLREDYKEENKRFAALKNAIRNGRVANATAKAEKRMENAETRAQREAQKAVKYAEWLAKYKAKTQLKAAA